MELTMQNVRSLNWVIFNQWRQWCYSLRGYNLQFRDLLEYEGFLGVRVSFGYNRGTVGGRVAGNERSFLPSAPFQMSQMDMEYEIHNLEQIAYDVVLRAFKAQSDALTWEKEGLITELRKELRVSDDEHRELLSQVNGDDLIRRIREWREAGGNRNIAPSAQHINNQLPSPTISASRNMLGTFGID
ncbi:protein EMSY-LIKE 3-like [Salvia splendens]|nr:protein EMSY-LIKE 3-like [Salvia splendens]